jgi:hypothetical protein
MVNNHMGFGSMNGWSISDYRPDTRVQLRQSAVRCLGNLGGLGSYRHLGSQWDLRRWCRGLSCWDLGLGRWGNDSYSVVIVVVDDLCGVVVIIAVVISSSPYRIVWPPYVVRQSVRNDNSRSRRRSGCAGIGLTLLDLRGLASSDDIVCCNTYSSRSNNNSGNG